MPTVHEQLTTQFYRWEQRGRGWQVHGEPVQPEPPFVSFDGHYPPETPVVDDGRKPTFLSSLFRKVVAAPALPPLLPEPEVEPEPTPFARDHLVELHTSLPADLDISQDAFEQFLLNLSLCREPVSFELVGTPGRVSVQFVAGNRDAPLVRRQLQAYFPDAVFQPRENALEELWLTGSGEETLVVEFGLAREFMFALASGRLDPFVGIVGALAELQANELAVFQVLWQAAQQPWAESIVRSVTHEDGKPFFVNRPELAKAAQEKVSRPLFAAVVRVATKAETFDRALQIACDLAGALRVFAHPHGNELIPLRNDDYPFEAHLEDLLRRQSRRTGMLLNSDELTGFVHLPGSAVRSPALQRDMGKSKAAPPNVRHERGLLLGHNPHLGATMPVRLAAGQRVYHTHLIGATGTGKSTLLFNLIRQDIEQGEGVAVLDPHGDLVDRILGIIPPERIEDVILVDPADEEFSLGFNILSAHSEHEKTLIASDLVSVFQRLSSSWGDQMHSVLQNGILAFLNSTRGGTLADLRRFLVEPAFRHEFLQSVSDPNVLYYWHRGFPLLSGNKSVGPILTRLEMFLAQRPIAHMVSQPENRLDFGEIMDGGKIFLAKLPEGLLGRENSYLLGALLVSKFQQLVMARQAKQIAARRDFWIYIDEFANFITPSMAEILSGARKYRIGLTLAHHELHQLQRSAEVASAVLTHPYTRIVFRVGDDDAKKLADGFSFFEARDLRNLETGQAVCRVERSDYDFNLTVPLPELPDAAAMAERAKAVTAASRQQYGTPRAEVEARLRQAWDVVSQPPATPRATKTKPPVEEPPAPPSPPAPPPVEPVRPKPAAPARMVSKAPVHRPPEVPKETGAEKDLALPVEPKAAPPASRVSETPPASDVPKPEAATLPVTSTTALPPLPAVAPADKPEPPRDLGRGGAQHKSIQERLQQEAHALGFAADIEKQLEAKSLQAADLVLRRGEMVIAVEIAVTTTVDHEFGNVKKCLAAGHTHVAVISPSRERLRQIATAVQAALPPHERDSVIYQTPDEFITRLRDIAATSPQTAPPERLVRGYRVKRSHPTVTPEERKQREAVAIRVLAEAMRKANAT